MTFQPGMIRGVAASGNHGSHVDYRLARRAVIRNFHNGRLSKLDVCDAHPELVRAARNVGEGTSEVCPICEDTTVVLVSYVFGENLGPSGHCVSTKAELRKLAKRSKDMTCYVVEVCPACSWNHLAQSFQVESSRMGVRRSAR
jgi:hypothetical protein